MSENKEPKGRATHPMIGLITGELHQENICISKGEIKQAARGLLNVIDLIKPSHIDEELHKELGNIAFDEKEIRSKHHRSQLLRISGRARVQQTSKY